MRGLRVGAGDEGVQAFDLVHEAVRDKEVQRSIGNGRLRSEPGIPQAVQNFVSPKGAVILQKHLERLAPHRGQPQPLPRA